MMPIGGVGGPRIPNQPLIARSEPVKFDDVLKNFDWNSAKLTNLGMCQGCQGMCFELVDTKENKLYLEHARKSGENYPTENHYKDKDSLLILGRISINGRMRDIKFELTDTISEQLKTTITPLLKKASSSIPEGDPWKDGCKFFLDALDRGTVN